MLSIAADCQAPATRRYNPETDALTALGVQTRFDRDDEIYAQGDEAEYVYRVVAGVVRTSRLTSDGRRQIEGFYYPGEMIGLEDPEQHCFSAEALTDCTVLAIRRRLLESEAERNAEISRLLWLAGSSRMRRMQSHLLQIGRKTALERVAAILADLSSRDASEEVELPMSRQDIADYLSLTIETVSRMLSQLQTSKIITLTGLRRLRVSNQMALQRLAA